MITIYGVATEPPSPVPAASEWGVAVMALLITIGATVVLMCRGAPGGGCRAWIGERLAMGGVEVDASQNQVGIIVPAASETKIDTWSGRLGAIHSATARSRLTRVRHLSTFVGEGLINGNSRLIHCSLCRSCRRYGRVGSRINQRVRGSAGLTWRRVLGERIGQRNGIHGAIQRDTIERSIFPNAR